MPPVESSLPCRQLLVPENGSEWVETCVIRSGFCYVVQEIRLVCRHIHRGYTIFHTRVLASSSKNHPPASRSFAVTGLNRPYLRS